MVVPHEYFDPLKSISAIANEKCTSVYGVPTMFAAMLAQETLGSMCAHGQLRTGIMAGSPCPIDLMMRLVDEVGCKEMTIAYGLTEASPVVTQSSVDDSIEVRVRTVGRPLPGVEVKLVASDGSTVLPTSDSEGELRVRGHGVFRGYYNNAEATSASFDAEGFLKTGDLAKWHGDGINLVISGRAKDLIIRGGENICPKEVEDVLFHHHLVLQASVFGIPDKLYGEVVVVWVQLRSHVESEPEQQSVQAELRRHCLQYLAHFKCPTLYRFVKEFPTTVSGKIQKFRMREIEAER